MRYELFISLRYLTAKRKERFISAISLISILGVALGVMALIVVIAVMSGFDVDLRNKIVGTNAHILIQKEKGFDNPEKIMSQIKDTKDVVASAPYVDGQAVIKYKEEATGVIVRGIDPELEAKVTDVSKHLIDGNLSFGDNGIVLGSELARRLGAWMNESVIIITAVTREPVEMKVCGIFNSGMYEYDSTFTFVSLKKAQELYNTKDNVSGVAVKINDVEKADMVKKQIQEKVGFEYWVMSWMDSNKNLFSALKLEKAVMFLILALIVTVACFNIASTLIMVVMEKTKDIGILKSIGVPRHSIMAIFTLEGLLIGVLGTALGAASGFFMCDLLKKYDFIQLPKDVYYIDRLPVLVQWNDSLFIIIAAVLLSLASTIYPAWQASRIDPVEALRYE